MAAIVDGKEATCAGKVVQLEPRPFRPFKSSEEYLYAMKEDLAEWLNSLYGLDLTVDTFLERLETGVLLCRHANNVLRTARAWRASGQNGIHQIPLVLPDRDVVFRADVQPGTFQARDNVSNFISWCRSLAVKECLLFETDDLVLRKNERSFILCLLEVARRGARFGMLVPLLVQMEQEIEAELAKDGSDSDEGHEADDDSDTQSEPRVAPQIITNDLRSLHERVVDLLNRCSCPSQFPMIRVADGKYRIGDTQMLIFVRILRNHVMVRVGGGWDTLEHYLDKHDPCRCRIGHRFSTSAKLTVVPTKGGNLQMQVTYNRPSLSGTPTSSRSSSVTTSPPSRRRSLDLGRVSQSDREEMRDPVARGSSRNSHYSDDSSNSSVAGYQPFSDVSTAPSNDGTPRRLSRGKAGHPSSADSSSEVSESEGRSGMRCTGRQRRYSPRKIMRIGESTGDSDSLMSLSPPPPPDPSIEDEPTSPPPSQPDPVPFKSGMRKSSLQSPSESDIVEQENKGRSDAPATPVRSKIPCPRNRMLRLSSGQRSQSSEDLSTTRLISSKSEASLVTQKNRGTSPNFSKTRRASSGFSSNGRPGMPRSNTCEDTERGFSFYRLDTGRDKPRQGTDSKNRNGDNCSKTWTYRQRSPRSSTSMETFRSASRTPTPQRSPAKTPSSTPHRTPRSPLSPVQSVLNSRREIPPLLEEILQVDFLDSDDLVLHKMEMLINQFKTKDGRDRRSSRDIENLSNGDGSMVSPDDSSDGSLQGLMNGSPTKGVPRRKSVGSSPSKIPVPTWTRRD